jgi:hypothetical protein
MRQKEYNCAQGSLVVILLSPLDSYSLPVAENV